MRSASGPFQRETVTNASGSYTMTVPVGDYSVTASLFGYLTQTQPATITEGQTTTLNVANSVNARNPTVSIIACLRIGSSVRSAV